MSTLYLDEDVKKNLIDAAFGVMERSYCPYSKFPVGAALLTASDEIITGGKLFIF